MSPEDIRKEMRQQMNAAAGANLARNPVDLSRACMPLVRLLRKEGLSWSDREEIAWAIQDNLRIYGDMEAERQHIAGAAAGGMMARGFGSGG